MVKQLSYMTYFLLFSLMLVTLYLATGNKNALHVAVKHHDYSKQKTDEQILVVPQGYRPMQNTNEHTSDIGTADHPTIDGGIINSQDNYSIHRVAPRIPIQTMKQETHSQTANHQDVPFHDDWVSSQKVEWLLQMAAQGGKLNYVLKKSGEQGLPASVALLPIVESEYQSHAVSPKGAAGAWQLMPSVAKQYGISNQERFEFQPATDVALKLLIDLHKTFKNWELTFAAYNAGSQRIMRAVQKNPMANSIDDLDVPNETKNYVHRIKSIAALLGETNA